MSSHMFINNRGTSVWTSFAGVRHVGQVNSSRPETQVTAELRHLRQKMWSHCRRTGRIKAQWHIGHIRWES